MLEIRSTKKGYVANQEISPRLFEQVGNTIVRVICEIHKLKVCNENNFQ